MIEEKEAAEKLDKEDIDAFLKDLKGKNKDIIIVDEHGNVLKSLNEDTIKLWTQELIEMMILKVRDKRDFGMAQAALKQLLEIKKSYYPATQKSITANIDIWNQQLRDWMEARAMVINAPNKTNMEVEINSAVSDVEKEFGDGK